MIPEQKSFLYRDKNLYYYKGVINMYRYRIIDKNLINNKWIYSVEFLGTNEVKMLNEYNFKSLLETNYCTNAIVRSNKILEIYDVEQAISDLVVALNGSNKLLVQVVKVLNTRPNKKRAYMKFYNKKGTDITSFIHNVLQRYTSLTSKCELSIGGNINANLVDVVINKLREQVCIFELPNIIDTNYICLYN